MRLIPNSDARLAEANECHDPKSGEFCSTPAVSETAMAASNHANGLMRQPDTQKAMQAHLTAMRAHGVAETAARTAGDTVRATAHADNRKFHSRVARELGATYEDIAYDSAAERRKANRDESRARNTRR